MAIKGKGKTRTRQPARAPRRAPVEVPTPFPRRRWVQVTAALLVGAGIVWFLIWLTNGIRDNEAETREAAATVERRRALQGWKTLVETEIPKVGTLGAPGTPPALAPELAPTIQALANGGDDLAPIDGLADRLDASADALEEFDLTTAIREKGFDMGEAAAILNSQDRFVVGLRLYASAARLTTEGAGLDDRERTAILDEAESLTEHAAASVTDAWNAYSLGLAAAGLAPADAGLAPADAGLPPGLGTSGLPNG